MTQFIFSHGFGFNAHFWDNLATFFSKENCFFIDWGYFNNPTPLPIFDEQNTIGIGHSLGFSKLINLHEHFSCLIGLNSFTHFLGYDKNLYQKRYLELRALKKNFIKNPIHSLQAFYERCGVPQFNKNNVSENLDINRLLGDLDLLKQPTTLPLISTLILSTNDDIIVNPLLVKDNFFNRADIKLETIHHAGHGLGYTKPEDVYNKIMSFLDEQLGK